MKKIFLIIGVFALVMTTGLLTSCGDNTDVSTPHELTDDEIAELERQDSLKKLIKADLILEYKVEDYASSSTWTSKNVEIDFNKIGELFGLTADQVKAGINQEEGAPEITGFAIQNSINSDYSVASTTNGKWGHWWSAKTKDPCKYAEGNLAFYCEWQSDYFVVGQNPGALSEGDSYIAYECLKYQDKRVAIKIIFNIVAREEVGGTIVDTQEYQLAEDIDSTYAAYPVTIDMDGILSKLGVSSVGDVAVIGFNEDGSYAVEFTADLGFWYTKDGYPGTWGDTAYAYMNYMGKAEGDDCNPNQLMIGQMPSAAQSGDVVSLPIGFYANKKIVKVIVNLTIN